MQSNFLVGTNYCINHFVDISAASEVTAEDAERNIIFMAVLLLSVGGSGGAEWEQNQLSVISGLCAV